QCSLSCSSPLSRVRVQPAYSSRNASDSLLAIVMFSLPRLTPRTRRVVEATTRQALVSGPLSRWLPVCTVLHAAPSVETWIWYCARSRPPSSGQHAHQVRPRPPPHAPSPTPTAASPWR